MILKPTNDISFKKVFQDKDILKEFINDSLKQGVVDKIVEVIVDSTNPADRADTKVCVTDVYCRSETGEEFIVEMQLSSQPDFKKRVVFYSSRTFTNQISKGVPYKDLQCLYLIVVCDFIVLKDCSWYSRHRMLNETKLEEMEGIPFSKATMIQCDFPVYTYVVLQLPKFDEIFSNDSSAIKLWMIFLKRANNLSNEERCQIIEKKPILKNAINKLEATNFSDEEVLAYERFEDIRRIAESVSNEHASLKEENERVKEENERVREEVERVREEVERVREEIEREREEREREREEFERERREERERERVEREREREEFERERKEWREKLPEREKKEEKRRRKL